MNKESYICSNTCLGIESHHGDCCNIEERDFIIGPVSDAERVVKDLSERFNRTVNKEEIFIDFLEGSNLFTDRQVWQKETSYPALRVDLSHDRKPCIFYNNTVKACSIYDIRPSICRHFKCNFLANMKQD